MKPSISGQDGKLRCFWCHETEQYTHYHDTEWGYPVDDDRRLFEKLCLEGFQAGLSWLTILKKRENFRAAFDNFQIDKVAKYTDKDVERLLQNAGIVRHRGKIEAVINNAKCAQALIKEEGSLANYFWRFEPDEKKQPEPMSLSVSELSKDISKQLKKQGWKFVGPTTIYSFMQAMGLINDHAKDCAFREVVDKARKGFKRPS
ncbi:MAG: DNA-3-methyladenine glycosylase I [Cellvibrionales bacterium]|nr:DNA-3-methyladenine glycosylase I [Cellvibrionales bacterium]